MANIRRELGELLVRLGELDERVFVVTADLGYKVLCDGENLFAERFPDRFLNVGVAESVLPLVAAGLAREGYQPWCYTMCAFWDEALGGIKVDVAWPGLDVKLVGVGRGDAYGEQGFTHWGRYDGKQIAALPFMRVWNVGSVQRLKWVVAAMYRRRGPCYLRIR